jgi:hypothetical protein
MVLASGPGLIEDMRKAPDDVLGALEPRIEVCQCEKRRGHTHKNYLGPSTRIYTGLIEPERHIQLERSPFKINPGYSSYF